MVWMSFKGSKLLCRKSSFSSSIIPNFCLGSQPSGIPLILHGLPFGFQLIEAPYIVFHHCLFIFFSLMLSTIYIYIYISFFSRYGYKRGLDCFNLLEIVGFKISWALKRTWSLWVALRRLTFSGLEWWHILSMVHSYYKDHCVTLVGLQCCSYYSTCRISRQFGERQRVLDDEGAFHTLVFTNRILGRINEAWPCRRVMKDIGPPKYIYPTTSYKQWLEDDRKWILRDEKAYVRTSKKARRTE